MIICCICGCVMNNDNSIPKDEVDRIEEMICSDRMDEMTDIQHIAMFEGFVCNDCYIKG